MKLIIFTTALIAALYGLVHGLIIAQISLIVAGLILSVTAAYFLICAHQSYQAHFVYVDRFNKQKRVIAQKDQTIKRLQSELQNANARYIQCRARKLMRGA